jgi:hypothetical protein
MWRFCCHVRWFGFFVWKKRRDYVAQQDLDLFLTPGRVLSAKIILTKIPNRKVVSVRRGEFALREGVSGGGRTLGGGFLCRFISSRGASSGSTPLIDLLEKEDLMKSHVLLRRVAFLGFLLAAFAAIVSDGRTVQASSDQLSLKEMVAQSELAFIGRVDKIEYALSEPAGPEGVRVPHTFVTYRVEQVFLGEAPSGLVTLRFVGGLDPRKMRYMASTNTPQFDVGDHDILFVQGNSRRLCPLVGGVGGRLRVIDGQVYTEAGRAVLMGSDGSLRYGGMYRLEEVMTTQVNGRPLSSQRMGPGASELPSNAVGAEALMGAIADFSRNATPPQVFVNADGAVPFAGPDMTPAPPPAETSPGRPAPGKAD